MGQENINLLLKNIINTRIFLIDYIYCLTLFEFGIREEVFNAHNHDQWSITLNDSAISHRGVMRGIKCAPVEGDSYLLNTAHLHCCNPPYHLSFFIHEIPFYIDTTLSFLLSARISQNSLQLL